jgi:glucosylglycerate synthase
LAEDTFLQDDFLRQLMSVGEVDLLVGVPTYNNAATIGQFVQTIEDSFQQNFVRDRVVVLGVDGGSTDNTLEAVLKKESRHSAGRGLTSLRTVHRVASRYGSAPSQGRAVRTILAAADLLRAKSCAVVSPATVNLSPSWVANLLRPVHRDNFDFVAPLYARNKFQGVLARNLLYPMSRAVFGRRIREIYSQDWAFSGRLATQCLERDVWHQEPVLARTEAWMGVCAIRSDLRICQSFLGPRLPPPSGTGPDIVEAIRQTVGNLFWCLEDSQSYWIEHTESRPVPTFGPDHELTNGTGSPAGQDKIFDLFLSGVVQLEPVLSSILDQMTLAQIKQIAGLEQNSFRFGPELWVKTVYEFAAAYHNSVINRDHIVQALVPLYRGMLYSFLLEHANSSTDEMEASAENLCLEFERKKPYLIERWTTKVEVQS